MNSKFQLSKISEIRTELMGLSAILILICHSVAYIEMPRVLHYSLSLGNIGVDLFLFLSGMGMWYSLSKMHMGGVKQWYTDRYIKLFVPYLVIVLPLNAIEYVMGLYEGQDIWNYLFGLTTLRFFVSHDAPWFIAALLPLYLLAPLFNNLIKMYQWKATLMMIVMLYATLLIPTTFSSEMLNNVISNIQFVAVRATCFVLGMGMGQAVKEEEKINLLWILLLTVVGLFAVALTRHLVYGYFFFTLPLLVVLCKLVEYSGDWLRISAGFMGKISLESYLLNGILPKMIIVLFTAFGFSTYNNVVPYLIACLLGCAIGYVFHMLSNKLVIAVNKQ